MGLYNAGWLSQISDDFPTAFFEFVFENRLRLVIAPAFLVSFVGFSMLFTTWLLSRTEAMSVRKSDIHYYVDVLGFVRIVALILPLAAILSGVLAYLLDFSYGIAAAAVVPTVMILLSGLINHFLPLLPPSEGIKNFWTRFVKSKHSQINLSRETKVDIDFSEGRNFPFPYGTLTIFPLGQPPIIMHDVPNPKRRGRQVLKAARRLRSEYTQSTTNNQLYPKAVDGLN